MSPLLWALILWYKMVGTQQIPIQCSLWIDTLKTHLLNPDQESIVLGLICKPERYQGKEILHLITPRHIKELTSCHQLMKDVQRGKILTSCMARTS